MDSVYIVLVVLAVILLIFLLIHEVLRMKIARMTMRNRYEWLTVLDHEKWKSFSMLLKEAETKMGARFPGYVIHQDLIQLHDEDFIEMKRIAIPGKRTKLHFRLTQQGIKRRRKIRSYHVEQEDDFLPGLPT